MLFKFLTSNVTKFCNTVVISIKSKPKLNYKAKEITCLIAVGVFQVLNWQAPLFQF